MKPSEFQAEKQWKEAVSKGMRLLTLSCEEQESDWELAGEEKSTSERRKMASQMVVLFLSISSLLLWPSLVRCS